MKGQLEQYLLGLLPPDNEWVSDLEKQALHDHVPIMDKISVHFLMQLVSISKPQRILEVGTAIGYSALRMLEAYPSTSIVTIEKDACRYTQAIENIKRLQQDNHIQVIYGDAKEELSSLSSNEEKFDFVFIDAAKGEYQQYFEQASSLLTLDGLIISDNILFRGYVAGDQSPPHRYKNMIKKIRSYNEWLVNLADFTTTIVPIGDGLAISKKCLE
ncbi:MAG TPA: O-methyltransferase [Candidatus Dormibacteraeota bacterium]|nr:O-methyltransferase [Candidatus Dormibacteraeota bacterium]